MKTGFFNVDDIIIIYKTYINVSDKIVNDKTLLNIVGISHYKEIDILDNIIFNPILKIVSYNNIFNLGNFKINKKYRGLRIDNFNCDTKKFKIDNINKDVCLFENLFFDISIYNKQAIINNNPDRLIKPFNPIIDIYFNPDVNVCLIQSNEIYEEPLRYIEFR